MVSDEEGTTSLLGPCPTSGRTENMRLNMYLCTWVDIYSFVGNKSSRCCWVRSLRRQALRTQGLATVCTVCRTSYISSRDSSVDVVDANQPQLQTSLCIKLFVGDCADTRDFGTSCSERVCTFAALVILPLWRLVVAAPCGAGPRQQPHLQLSLIIMSNLALLLIKQVV